MYLVILILTENDSLPFFTNFIREENIHWYIDFILLANQSKK